MIKAQELRLGNKIFSTVVFVTNPLSKDAITCDEEFLEVLFAAINYEDYEPIPLTPELLIKCGFKHGKVKGVTRFVDDFEDIDPTDKKKYTYYWDLSIPKNSHVDDLNTFSLVQFGKGTDIFWKHQMLAVKIKSLHQLQNLYFSLTGEELQITL